MSVLITLLLGVIIGLLAVFPIRKDKASAFERFYVVVVFFVIGINGILFGAIPHIFFADYIAKNIGWPTGSPFQFEVGVHDGCWGILGILSARYKQGFIQATSVGYSIFLLIAGGNHLRETVFKGNFAPYNFQYIAGDILPAVILLFLAWHYSKRNALN